MKSAHSKKDDFTLDEVRTHISGNNFFQTKQNFMKMNKDIGHIGWMLLIETNECFEEWNLDGSTYTMDELLKGLWISKDH